MFNFLFVSLIFNRVIIFKYQEDREVRLRIPRADKFEPIELTELVKLVIVDGMFNGRVVLVGTGIVLV